MKNEVLATVWMSCNEYEGEMVLSSCLLVICRSISCRFLLHSENVVWLERLGSVAQTTASVKNDEMFSLEIKARAEFKRTVYIVGGSKHAFMSAQLDK